MCGRCVWAHVGVGAGMRKAASPAFRLLIQLLFIGKCLGVGTQRFKPQSLLHPCFGFQNLCMTCVSPVRTCPCQQSTHGDQLLLHRGVCLLPGATFEFRSPLPRNVETLDCMPASDPQPAFKSSRLLKLSSAFSLQSARLELPRALQDPMHRAFRLNAAVLADMLRANRTLQVPRLTLRAGSRLIGSCRRPRLRTLALMCLFQLGCSAFEEFLGGHLGEHSSNILGIFLSYPDAFADMTSAPVGPSSSHVLPQLRPRSAGPKLSTSAGKSGLVGFIYAFYDRVAGYFPL